MERDYPGERAAKRCVALRCRVSRPATGGNMQATIGCALATTRVDILNAAGGNLASAVVADPRSGAVLALVSTPPLAMRTRLIRMPTPKPKRACASGGMQLRARGRAAA